MKINYFQSLFNDIWKHVPALQDFLIFISKFSGFIEHTRGKQLAQILTFNCNMFWSKYVFLLASATSLLFLYSNPYTLWPVFDALTRHFVLISVSIYN
jgi:hypothetical protein